MNIEMADIKKIIPYARNPRRNASAVKKVVASIREFGWRQPIVVDSEMVVIAGHTRLAAAIELGMDEVPVHVATGLTPAQVKAYRLADNRVGQEAEWDDDLLAIEIGDIEAAGYDLSLTGFDADELASALAEEIGEGHTDPDDVPEAPSEPVTRRGDVIVLGRHRLLCGDSTSQTDVDRLMVGDLADCIWTDPPYGVSYVGKTKDALTIENDALDEGSLETFLREALGCAFAATREGGGWYVAAPAGPLHHVFSTILRELGVWRQTLTWVKSSMVLGRSDYHYRHEPIFYGWREGAAHAWHGDRKQTTVLEFAKPSRNADHPTMKPVELVEYCISNSTKKGEIVLDPFGGSGTTLLAAERTGRAARLMELDPKYCDVIVRRWEEHTGKKAVRDGGSI